MFMTRLITWQVFTLDSRQSVDPRGFPWVGGDPGCSGDMIVAHQMCDFSRQHVARIILPSSDNPSPLITTDSVGVNKLSHPSG
jgi:hypothetical protein